MAHFATLNESNIVTKVEVIVNDVILDGEGVEQEQLGKDYGEVYFIKHFPFYTSPFWNMKKEGDFANKCDVIIGGMETIGSAERSADPVEMREQFHTISDGEYASLLYELFGEERVEKDRRKHLI